MSEVVIAAPDGIRGLADAGLARALSGDWTSGTNAERLRDFWGYTLAHVYVESRLVGKYGVSMAEGQIYALDASIQGMSDTPKVRAAGTLRQTLIDLAQINSRTGSRFTAAADLVPGRLTLNTETGWLPILAAVVVKVAAAAAVAYCFSKASEVVDNYLARDANVRAIVKADAHALQLVKQHQDREDAAGSPLPLDEATTLELERLDSRRRELVDKMPKLPPPKTAGFNWTAFLAIGGATVAFVYLTRPAYMRRAA